MRRYTSAAGAFLTVLVALFLPSPLGRGLANLSYDLPFQVRPNILAEEAVVIYMDEDSAKKLGEPWEPQAWDRLQHARLINRLAACHAKAVVFDVLFDTPATNDAALIEAIKAAGQSGTRVIVGGTLEITALPGQAQYRKVVPPIAALESVAPFGLAELGDRDVIARRHFAGDPVSATPSLAGRAAELILEKPWPEMTEERWINYYGRADTLRHRSFHEVVLDTNLDLAVLFSNKVCFVGAKPGKPFASGLRVDEWRTPYGTTMPGVELTATVYLNLARHEWLQRPPWGGDLILLLGTGLLLGGGLALCRPGVAVGLGAASVLLIVVVAGYLMWQHFIWFSWLFLVAVQVPTAVGWSSLAYLRQITHEKSMLEKKLATITQAAVPMEGGLAGGKTSSAPASADNFISVAGSPSSLAVPVIPDHNLVRQVGRGAYGEVWLASNAIGSYHVVKIVRRSDFNEAEPYEREFRGLQKFMPISRSHPGLVQILHVGRHDAEGFIYYIMEAGDDEVAEAQIDPDTYVPKNLARDIRRRGHWSAVECLRLGLQLTAALEFLHQRRLIHRDIKPSNIIFVNGMPKLADIGLVTDIATTGREVTYLGTKGYIAPEGPGTPAADLYSLGIVLYEASAGRGVEQFPEIPSTLRQRPDHATFLQLNAILLKACRQAVSERYQSAAAMHADLLTCKKR